MSDQDLCYPEPGPSRTSPVYHIGDDDRISESGTSTPLSSPDSSAIYSRASQIGDPELAVTESDEIEGLDRTDDTPLIRRGDAAYDILVNPWGLVPPKNFGEVLPGQIFRSSFPRPENVNFLRTKNIRTILTLVPEAYPPALEEFLASRGVKHIRMGIEPNKDPFAVINPAHMTSALSVVMDKSNYPLLIHCNKGKHRTGCLVGCFRKMSGGTPEKIFEEYRHYAGPKARILDERFIDMFDIKLATAVIRERESPDEPFKGSPISVKSVSTRLKG